MTPSLGLFACAVAVGGLTLAVVLALLLGDDRG